MQRSKTDSPPSGVRCMSRLTTEEEAQLSQLVADELQQPPTIGVVGMSGVGKSSTINSLFRTKLDISHTVACTKEFWEIESKIDSTSGPAAGHSIELRIFDAPGLGEDLRRDPYYLERYAELLPQCDVILWILAARNRAVALDQMYLEKLSQLSDRMVFGLSQVDIVDPLNWNPSLPIPSKEQERNIVEIIADRAERLGAVLGKKVTITPYSNEKGYNLEALFAELLAACAGKRKWIFQGIKGFSFEDFLPGSIKQMTKGAEPYQKPSPEPSAASSRRQDAFASSPNPFKWLSGLADGFAKVFDPSRLSADDHALICRVIGRSDIETTPLTADELDLMKAHLRAKKR